MSQGLPKYSVFSGDLVHGITHELVHEYTSLEMGILNYRKLPSWKREGYAEFSASRIQAINDKFESLQDRISEFNNAVYWTEHVKVYYRFDHARIYGDRRIGRPGVQYWLL